MAKALIAEQASASRDPGNPQSTYSLQSLARIAGVLQDEFLPYLDQAITPLLAVLATDAEVSLTSSSRWRLRPPEVIVPARSCSFQLDSVRHEVTRSGDGS